MRSGIGLVTSWSSNKQYLSAIAHTHSIPSIIGYTQVDMSWILFGYEENIIFMENIIILSIEYI